jgi:hypothetical protein
MLYTLLGKLVWRLAKLFLRPKYGPTYLPKPVVAGALVAVVIGLLVLLGKREDSASA